ncbi:hypothetical protein BGZ57DRAFT_853034 [Hyaloscypha finlandica]|nr:hypothetical protein BGZ57DRAFT_853034 [Hyaloscypha finlandica]
MCILRPGIPQHELTTDASQGEYESANRASDRNNISHAGRQSKLDVAMLRALRMIVEGRALESREAIDGCKQQAGRAPVGNCSALLTYELHILWSVAKVALICPTVGIKMSSSQPTSGNCELCMVELCVASVPSGDVPHEEVLRGGVPCGEVPNGEGLRGEVPQREVPDGDVPQGVSHGDSVPRRALYSSMLLPHGSGIPWP